MRDLIMNRPIALKVNKAEEKRFLREIHTLSQLYHQHIMPIYDIGKTLSGQFYYTMKWINGNSLERILQKIGDNDAHTRNTYTPKKLLNMFLAVCRAIEFAHAKGFLHRDIKPANIMVDKLGDIVVCDWGLAKKLQTGEEKEEEDRIKAQALEEELTQHGIFLGTIAYASPEQLEKNISEIGIQSDLYSLGVILYEIVFETHPYPHRTGTVENMRMLILQGKLAKKNRDVAEELKAIVSRAMASQPENRYRFVRELILDIENYLAHRPVSVCKYTAWKIFYKWIRRHPLLSLLYLILVVLVISLGYSWYANYHWRISERYNRFNKIIMDTKRRVEGGLKDKKRIVAMLGPMLNSNNSYFYREIGKIFFTIGDMDDADKYYKLAEKLIGDIKKDPIIRIYQIELMWATWTYGKSREEVEKHFGMLLLSIDSNRSTDSGVQAYCQAFEAWRKCTNSSRSITDNNKFIKLFSRAKECYPEISAISYYRGMSYHSLWELDKSKNDLLDKALNDYNDAIRFSPYNADIYFNRHFIYKYYKRYSEAIHDLQMAIQNNSPKSQHVYYPYLSYIYHKIGRYAEALKYIKESEKKFWQEFYPENLRILIRLYGIRIEIYKKHPSLLTPDYKIEADELNIRKARKIINQSTVENS